jgi:hypothetical protein
VLLEELQQSFGAFLAGTASEAPTGLVDRVAERPGSKLTAQSALLIYRENSAATRQNALRETYPAVLSLVGAEYFDAAARRYALRYPATSADLNFFGEHFADLLATLPDLAQRLPYIEDVARFEWVYNEVYYAEAGSDQTPVRIFASPFPVDEIYRLCLDPDAEHLDLDASGSSGSEIVRLILFRNEDRVVFRRVDLAFWRQLESQSGS